MFVVCCLLLLNRYFCVRLLFDGCCVVRVVSMLLIGVCSCFCVLLFLVLNCSVLSAACCVLHVGCVVGALFVACWCSCCLMYAACCLLAVAFSVLIVV